MDSADNQTDPHSKKNLFPYDAIAPNQIWQKSVSSVENHLINPHSGSTAKFKFSQDTKIASAGSCFAQRLSENLQAFGFHYLITEPGPAWLPETLRQQYHYGSYSARFGNIYSSLQMLQLFQRAYGEFEPIEPVWQSGDGWIDPFRPRIQPKGFVSLKEFQADQASHLAAVRNMFEEAEVFVFTLGLTEIWQDKRDGSVYPVCPGRQWGVFDPDLYAFKNLGVTDNLQHMTTWLDKLKQVNPHLKILLTVSPVPLAATMENQHVLQATVYSKSVLRVVAEELCRTYPQVDYFASYEIITATYNNLKYYQDDKRNVTDTGVEHVIRVFFDHFSEIPYQQCRRIEQPQVHFEPEPCDEEELLEYLKKRDIKNQMTYNQHGSSTPDLSSTETRLIARAEPLYVFGDSHALIFKDLLFYETRIFKQHFIVKSHYISGLCASNFSDGQSGLHPRLIQALAGASLLTEIYSPAHLETAEHIQSEMRAADRYRQEPVLLFCVGDIDVRSIFLKQLGEQVDFILPFLAEDSAFNQPLAGQSIPFDLICAMIEELLNPFIQGLHFLKNKVGFKKIFVHSLPPQTCDDDQFIQVNKFYSPTALRYKATIAFNHLLQKQCSEQGIGFIDLWPHVTQHDQLNDVFHLDHVHLNKQAAQLSIQLLIDQLTKTLNYPIAHHYQLLYDRALQDFSAEGMPLLSEVTIAFKTDHIYQALDLIPPEQIAPLVRTLHYNQSVGNQHYRLDWMGNLLEPYTDQVLSANLDQAQLKQVHEMVYSKPVKAIIESCLQCHYTVLSCRTFKSLPHTQAGIGPQAFHLDGTPPGLHRLIIYLTDVDENSGPFEYLDPVTEESKYVTGGAGSMHIFDANQLRHRGRPPAKQERLALDIVLFPALPGVGEQVVWPGMNHWPVDPFYFSVAGYAAWPPLKTETIQIRLTEERSAKPNPLFNQIVQLLQQQNYPEIVAIYREQFSRLSPTEQTWLPALHAIGMALLAVAANEIGTDWAALQSFTPEQASTLPPGPLRELLFLNQAPTHPLAPELAHTKHGMIFLEHVEMLSQMTFEMSHYIIIALLPLNEAELQQLEKHIPNPEAGNIWLLSLAEISTEHLAEMFYYTSELFLSNSQNPILLELRLMSLLKGKPLYLLKQS